MKKKLFEVCTVCIPREHYPFLEGWVNHMLQQGVDHITIYDNTGSTGSTRAHSVYNTGSCQIQAVSKRGERYGELTKGITDAEIQQKLKSLPNTTIVKWQPRYRGNIVHGQVEQYVNFMRKRVDTVEWVQFIDLDEYLWAKEGLNFRSMLETTPEDVSILFMQDYHFEKRWGQNGPKELKDCIKHGSLTSPYITYKPIVRISEAIEQNIHTGWKVRNSRKVLSLAQYGFCHFNQLENDCTLQDINPFSFLDQSPLPEETFFAEELNCGEENVRQLPIYFQDEYHRNEMRKLLFPEQCAFACQQLMDKEYKSAIELGEQPIHEESIGSLQVSYSFTHVDDIEEGIKKCDMVIFNAFGYKGCPSQLQQFIVKTEAKCVFFVKPHSLGRSVLHCLQAKGYWVDVEESLRQIKEYGVEVRLAFKND